MIKLHKFKESEIEMYVDSNVRTFSLAPWNDPIDNHPKVRRLIQNHMNNNYHQSYVLKKEDELIGVSIGFKKAWMEGFEYYIDQFWIDEKYQNKGYGTKFMNLLKEAVLEIGCNAIILDTDLETPAEYFYKKNGFEELKGIVSLAINLK